MGSDRCNIDVDSLHVDSWQTESGPVAETVALLSRMSERSMRILRNYCFYPAIIFLQAEYNAADVIVMTLIRCFALLYGYYQLCHLRKLGSKYILGKSEGWRKSRENSRLKYASESEAWHYNVIETQSWTRFFPTILFIFYFVKSKYDYVF